MKILNSFNDFIFEQIFESNKIQLILSERLCDLLKSIEHPIAKK
jgi:hypothetical protein